MASRAHATPMPQRTIGRSDEGTFRDLATICKPRVTALVVFSAACGYLSSEEPTSILGLAALIGYVGLGSASAAALNHWFDSDIDQLMFRTQARPVASGRLDCNQVLRFGLGLAVISVILAGIAANALTAALLAAAEIIYVGIYTLWLKRRSSLNIVIGGVAGALPVLIGSAAASGRLTDLALLLFAVVTFWTPPHFWALCLITRSEYAAARIPMMPVVAGYRSTRKQILLYAMATAAFGVTPYILHLTGALYGVAAIVLNILFVFLAARSAFSHKTVPGRMKEERQLFGYSIIYLFATFAFLAADRLLLF